MPPVEASAIALSGSPSAAAAAPWVLAASSSPRLPVAAFAQPELARIARRALSWQRSWLSSTGAAGAPVAVKRAALTGCSASHTSSPTSGLPLGLIPHVTPAALKPAGRPASSAELTHVRRRGHPARAEERLWRACGDPVAEHVFAGAHSNPLVSG